MVNLPPAVQIAHILKCSEQHEEESGDQTVETQIHTCKTVTNSVQSSQSLKSFIYKENDRTQHFTTLKVVNITHHTFTFTKYKESD